MRFDEIRIEPPDEAVYRRIMDNWDKVAKPLDGLGAFEPLLAQIGAILGDETADIGKKGVVVFCADNGIVEEGVSQSGQEVTALMAKNMGAGNTSVCKMARSVGADVFPVDIGMNTDEAFPGVFQGKIAKGTENFAKIPAMTVAQAKAAIETGMETVFQLKEQGYRILATGEMGIGNTTTGSAVAAALLHLSADTVTGRGAGLDDAGLLRKRQVIAQAIKRYGLYEASPFDVLCAVGGLDIAGLTGAFLGGAVCHLPIVIDGAISAAAALLAERLCPGVVSYMIPSHLGKEPASGLLLKELRLSPVIHADLALGEGTGAVMMFALLDTARSLYGSGATFADVALAPYERRELT